MKVKVVIYNDSNETKTWEFREKGELTDLDTDLPPYMEQEVYLSKGDTAVLRRDENGNIFLDSDGEEDPTCEGIWPEDYRLECLEYANKGNEE